MDEHLPFDREQFSGSLPLFPLPNVVLLPGGLLSLHIFEARYREMIRDIVSAERFLGMAVLRPGHENEGEPNPPIYEAACLGELTEERELPDGRWLITLRGVRRVVIEDEDQSRSYRVASVRVVDEVRGTLDGELTRLRQLIAQCAVRAPGTKMANSAELRRLLAASAEVVGDGLYVDLVAAITNLSIEERLSILRAETICERAHALISGLTRLICERTTRAELLRSALGA